MKKALYAGTFDPWTFGHEDIFLQASQLFDEVVILVCDNPLKKSMFSLNERVDMIEKLHPTTTVTKNESFPTVHIAELFHCTHLIRGIRSITDFEYEIQLANMNSRISQKVNTVYFTPELSNQYTSSTMVREFLRLNQDIGGLVPKKIKEAINDFRSNG